MRLSHSPFEVTINDLALATHGAASFSNLLNEVITIDKYHLF
jgi:hypothetical protein